MTPDEIRAALLKEAEWGVAHEPDIHYAQTRPIDLRGWKAHKLPWTGDCSAALKAIYRAAAGIDPDGLGNEGFTGTLLAAGERIAQREALPGDVGIFANGDLTTHGIMLMSKGSGADPWVFSHGQERGPAKYRLSVERAAHPGARLFWVTFIPGPDLWDLKAGNGSMIARDVEHPGQWASAHPKAFRKWDQVTFIRKPGK